MGTTSSGSGSVAPFLNPRVAPAPRQGLGRGPSSQRAAPGIALPSLGAHLQDARDGGRRDGRNAVVGVLEERRRSCQKRTCAPRSTFICIHVHVHPRSPHSSPMTVLR